MPADRGHVYQPGEDPLAAWPMSEEQRVAFLEHARANTTPVAVETGRLNRRRWERWRVYYPPNCPHGAYQVGDGIVNTWWCRP